MVEVVVVVKENRLSAAAEEEEELEVGDDDAGAGEDATDSVDSDGVMKGSRCLRWKLLNWIKSVPAGMD